MAKEIFALSPDSLRILSSEAIKNSASLVETFSDPFAKTTLAALLSTMPPTVSLPPPCLSRPSSVQF